MIEQLDDPLPLQRLLFVDLGKEEQRLFAQVHQIHAGCKVLRFLYQNANARLSADDIAFQVKESPTGVARSLEALAELGLAIKTDIAGWVFFGLAVEPKPREQVCTLFAWQKRWHTQLAHMGQVVDGETSRAEW